MAVKNSSAVVPSAGLPITHDLTLAYAVSLLVALLIAVMALQPFLTGSPIETSTIVGLLVFSVVCFGPLAFFVRGAARRRRSASPGAEFA